MKPVGIGLIGCGGRVRGLAQMMAKQSQDIRFVAFADPDPRSLEASKAALNPDAACSADYQTLLANPAVAWVMIGSWNCFHREHAVAAFAAGKQVFCEKPLATTLADCLAMRDAWQRSGKTFSIGFTLRYSPHYQKIKELIAGGAIGRLVSMEFNETLHFCHGGYIMGDWRRLTRNAGTHLLEKCCHDVDLVNWMVGSTARRVASFGGLDVFRPENAGMIARLGNDPKSGKPAFRTWGGPIDENPFTADKDIIDNQVAIIEFANGVRATFHTNCCAGIPERRMYFCGTEGAIRADVIKGEIQLQKIGFESTLENVDTGAKGGHGGGDHHLTANLIACMLGQAQPLSNLEDGLRSAITCFAIDEAMAKGQVVDAAPLWRQAGIALR
jgi:predicted dehydrogenase